MKTALAISLLVLSAVSTSALAGPEAGHPNIIAARESVDNALAKLHEAQAANEYDMGGHAAKAEQLLREALQQMKMAAEAANKNRK